MTPKTAPKPARRPASQPQTLEYWPIRMNQKMLASIAQAAAVLHANKSATARAAIRRGLPLVTADDVLKESY